MFENKTSISIHAAREGGDLTPDGQTYYIAGFQSTPPVKAATTKSAFLHITDAAFQSTPPVKAATAAENQAAQESSISIHAAREGGDWRENMRSRR